MSYFFYIHDLISSAPEELLVYTGNPAISNRSALPYASIEPDEERQEYVIRYINPISGEKDELGVFDPELASETLTDALNKYKENHLSEYVKLMSEVRPIHMVHIKSTELRHQIAKETGITNGKQYGFPVECISNINHLLLRTNSALEEFSRLSGLFSGLKELVVDILPSDRQPPMTECLIVPESVETLLLENSFCKALDISRPDLHELVIEANPLIERIEGLDQQSSLEKLVLSDIRNVSDLSLLNVVNNNPSVTVAVGILDAIDHNKSESFFEQYLSDASLQKRVEIYEINSERRVQYPADIVQSVYSKAKEILSETLTENMTKDEGAAMLYRYVAENVIYPSEDTEKAHSLPEVFFTREGVCEAQCKALSFIMSMAGIESRLVDCTMRKPVLDEAYKVEHFPSRNIYFQPSRQPVKELRGNSYNDPQSFNHVILRVKTSNGWSYCDPTNDFNLRDSSMSQTFSPLGFKSARDICVGTMKESENVLYLSLAETGVDSVTIPKKDMRSYYQDADYKLERVRTVRQMSHKNPSAVSDLIDRLVLGKRSSCDEFHDEDIRVFAKWYQQPGKIGESLEASYSALYESFNRCNDAAHGNFDLKPLQTYLDEIDEER